jgi:hypothetical protein
MRLEARQHLLFNVFYIGELAPMNDVAVFAGTLKLHNEFLHQPQLVPVFFPEMLFADFRRLFLPRFLIPYCAQDHTLERFTRRIQQLRREEKKGIPQLPARERCF